MKIIVHIGAHKTGTSYIQQVLFQSYDSLLSSGILYPKSIISGNNHGLFANSFKNKDSQQTLNMINLLDEEIAKHTPKLVIISSECFLEHKEIAMRFKERLACRIYDIEFLYYYREPVNWLSSLFNEIVRDPFRRYTGEIEESREFVARSYIHTNLAKPWIDSFGARTLSFYSYDEIIEQDGLISSFEGVLKKISPNAQLNKIDQVSVNKALLPPYVRLLQKLNQVPLHIVDYNLLVSSLNCLSNNDSKRYGTLIDIESISKIIDKTHDKNDNSKFYNCDVELEQHIFSKLPSSIQSKIMNNVSLVDYELMKDGWFYLNHTDVIDRQSKVIVRQKYEMEVFYGIKDTTTNSDNLMTRIIAQRNIVRDYYYGEVGIKKYLSRIIRRAYNRFQM